MKIVKRIFEKIGFVIKKVAEKRRKAREKSEARKEGDKKSFCVWLA